MPKLMQLPYTMMVKRKSEIEDEAEAETASPDYSLLIIVNYIDQLLKLQCRISIIILVQSMDQHDDMKH